MAIRSDTKSIIRVLGIITRNDIEMVNVFTNLHLKQSILEDLDFYEEYIIQETDRWDIISNRFYGTPFLYWAITNFNEIKDPFAGLVIGDKIRIIKPELISKVLIELAE